MLISVISGVLLSLISCVSAKPGLLPGLDFLPGPIHEPLYGPPLGHAPILAPEPIYAPAPIFAPAPVYAHAPVAKVIAPIAKVIAPATSYASITQYHISHPTPIIKAIAVAPPPIIKSYIPAPVEYGHGYH